MASEGTGLLDWHMISTKMQSIFQVMAKATLRWRPSYLPLYVAEKVSYR